MREKAQIYIFVVLLSSSFNRLITQLPREFYASETRNGDSLSSAFKHVAHFDFKNRAIIHAP